MTDIASFHTPSSSKAELEEGAILSPRFNSDGLVTAVVTDARNDHLLMVAHMNAQALKLTLKTGIAHYWSRSRNQLWKKGETSGNTQQIKEIRVDCDQDAIWLRVTVDGDGMTCHTNRRSCFYRAVQTDDSGTRLVLAED